MSTEQKDVAEQNYEVGGMLAHMKIDIKLGVHLDDGTTKELHLVGHNFKVEKEQK